MDSRASSRGQGKYTKYVNFSRPSIEAALSIYKFSISVKFMKRIY
jgi:hypothetical protein